jgi:hypothetical protein
MANPEEEARDNFLGRHAYYRRYISGFADISKPLTRLAKEKESV